MFLLPHMAVTQMWDRGYFDSSKLHKSGFLTSPLSPLARIWTELGNCLMKHHIFGVPTVYPIPIPTNN